MGGADYSRPAFPGRAYARKGREPYYAPNPLCGACFAKASQPKGMEKLPSSSRKCGTSEDMSKGARGGRGGEKRDYSFDLVVVSEVSAFSLV